jgi:hypothetical protein
VTAAKAEKFSITSTANTPPKSTITTSTIYNTVSLYMNYVLAVYVLMINRCSRLFFLISGLSGYTQDRGIKAN